MLFCRFNFTLMPPAQVFISYRRDDAAGYARAVYDELARQFGAARIFIDVDDIGAGLAFDEVIRSAVGEAQVLLVLIGRRWRGERDGQPARLDDPGDFVRLEVAAGLARGMRVIPLLLDGTPMPAAAQLPEPLRPLARRNALEIGNTRFAADMTRLVGVLREVFGEPAGATAPPPATKPAARRWMLAAGIVAVIVAGAVAAARWLPRERLAGPSDAAASQSASAAPAPARADVNGAWQAEVTYDWPNARYVERFDFAGEGTELLGSASFLGVRRGVLDGSLAPDGLRFVTRTAEVAGGSTAETLHRYRGRQVGDELRFTMQTEGGASTHVPVEFVARRVAVMQAGSSPLPSPTPRAGEGVPAAR